MRCSIMNLFVLKYCILIGAVLTSTALVTGPLNPQTVFTEESMTDSGEITADAMYQFGSDVLYRELDRPGNEYMKANMEGYSKELIPTEQQDETFAARWEKGVSLFCTGYRECTDSYFLMAAMPSLETSEERIMVCNDLGHANGNLRLSMEYFRAAKASSSAGSASGFTIGMVIPRAGEVISGGEALEGSCRRGVLALQDNDHEEFRTNLDEAGDTFRDMRRQYAELKALSGDFA